MTYFLGIDGGGTKTKCVVSDQSDMLGSAVAGGSNIVRIGEAKARRNLHAAIIESCQMAQLSPAQIGSACIGVAGVSATGVGEKVRAILAELVSGRIQVVGDMDIAMEAAFGNGPGVLVVAGTGSIAVGRDRHGKTARVGGWGYAISDEGSGHWIGRESVGRALHSWDTDDATALPKMVQEAWKVRTPEEVVRIANASPPPNFAELFPHVLKLANKGDQRACQILEDAAAELAQIALEASSRVRDDPGWIAPVAMIGGVFVQSEMVRERFSQLLHSRDLCVLPDVVDPVLGALALARKAVS